MTADAPPAAPKLTEATVMFADLVGFTALSERVGPEQAYLVATGCLRLLDGIAREHGGSVDKYLGDCLMAVFGYPVPIESPERAACRAALEMRRQIEQYNREADLPVPLTAVIGINTGSVVAGDIRGPVVREFHVLGDAVNVAARLKARAPAGGIYVGPATQRAGDGRFGFRSLEPLALKGRAKPLPAFELLAAMDAREAGGDRSPELHGGPLVGRTSELARLNACLSQVARGRGGIATLAGEEGSGKTRLLAELDDTGALAKLAVLRGGGNPLADGALDALRSLTHGGGAVAAALAEALDRAGEAPETALDAVAEALAADGDAEPRAIVLEDLQWADAASLELLGRLLPLARSRPILFLLSLRPDAARGADELVAAIRRHHAARHEAIELGPLSESECRRLLAQVAADAELSEGAAELVLARAGGNPARLLMAHFLAPALVSERDHARSGHQRSTETERRLATILFADITGFTAMTEKLGAERAYPIVAGCLRLLDEVARKHGGTVDKYLGDCVMALFGVPKAIEDAPRAAINAALEMRERVLEYNRERSLAMPLDVHSGINTGTAIAGDISGPLIQEYAVMGDPVDIADRLKDLAPSGSIYVGEATRRFTRDLFEYGEIEPVELKGRRQRVPAFALLSRDQQLYRARVGSGRQVFSAMVGREAEMARLEQRIRQLREGSGSVVGLIAEAGIGKSRMVAELARSVEEDGIAWLEGRSLSASQQLSFHPFADLCRSWAGIGDEDDEARERAKLDEAVERLMPGESDSVVPFVASIMGVRLDDEERGRLDRIQGEALVKMVWRALTEILRRGSERRPTVVVMDDLHWADQSSIELLESLLRLASERPILFLNVSRPGFASTSNRVREFAREHQPGLYEEIELQALDAAASRRLLNNLFKRGAIPHTTRSMIEAKARGNPFYIEEVVRSLVDAGAVEHHDGSFRATEKIHDVEIPGTINEVIMARVDGLPLGERRALQVASVIGGSFHAEVLAAVLGQGVDLAGTIAHLVEAEFLVPSDRAHGVEYAFKHPLIQEVTYDGILQAKREELHRRVADAIDRCLPDSLPGRLGMLAYHYSMGRDVERAEDFLFRAGDEAARVAASSEALHFFQEASKLYLELHGDGGDPVKKARLENNVATALYHRGQFIEAVEHYNLALDLMGERVPRRQAAVVLRFARNLLYLLPRLYLPGDGREGRAAVERDRDVIHLMLARGQAEVTGSPTRFVFDTTEMVAKLAHFDAGSVPRAAGIYAGAVGIFAYGGISFDVSRRFLERARVSLDEGDVGEVSLYRCMNFIHHFFQGDWSDEHELSPELIAESLRYGRLWEVVTYLGLAGTKHVHQGDWSRAREDIEQVDKIWDLYQYDLAKTNHYYLHAILALERRRLPEAINAAEAYFDENPEDLLHILALSSKARAQLLAGELDAADELLEMARVLVERVAPAPPLHRSDYERSCLLRRLVALEASQRDGDRAEARRHAKAAQRHARAALRAAASVACRRTEIQRLVGRLHWLCGDRRRAERAWRASLAEGARLGARPERARTCLEIARLLATAPASEREFEGRDVASWQGEAEHELADLDLPWDQGQLRRLRGGQPTDRAD